MTKSEENNKTKQEMAARDLRKSAFHEAGHVLVAEHYCIHGVDAEVFATGEGGKDNKYYRGQCRFLKCSPNLTPYKQSVIGWAGRIAGDLADLDLATWKAQLDDVWDCYDVASYLGNEGGIFSGISKTDLEMISAHSKIRRSFNRAATLIERGYKTLQTIAGRLVADANHAPKKSVY